MIYYWKHLLHLPITVRVGKARPCVGSVSTSFRLGKGKILERVLSERRPNRTSQNKIKC